MIQLRLTPVTGSDLEFLFHLRRTALGDYIESTWGWNEVWQRADFDARFNPETQNVILLNEIPVGMLEVHRATEEIRLCDIQISPEFQGRGIGTLIIQNLLTESRASGIPVRLQVLRINERAQKLYARLGFRVIGEQPPHIFMLYSPATDP